MAAQTEVLALARQRALQNIAKNRAGCNDGKGSRVPGFTIQQEQNPVNQ